MKDLAHFSLPYKGMKDGMHHFDFEVDTAFFTHFESSPVKQGTFQVGLDIEKKSDHAELFFTFKGKAASICDRCLAEIMLPIDSSYEILLKYDENERDEDEIIYVSRDISVLNVAQYVYEFICLSLPMMKVYDCDEEENPPCNFVLLKKLEDQQNEDVSNESNPLWDSLKNLNIDN